MDPKVNSPININSTGGVASGQGISAKSPVAPSAPTAASATPVAPVNPLAAKGVIGASGGVGTPTPSVATPVAPVEGLQSSAMSAAPNVPQQVKTAVPPVNIGGVNGPAVSSVGNVEMSSGAIPVSGLTEDLMNSSVNSVEGGTGETLAKEVKDTNVEGNAPISNPFATSEEKPTPSVSFADPTMQPEPKVNEQVSLSSKKKSNKTALIVLSVIAFIVAAGLAAVLVMELMGVGPFATS